MKDFEKPADIVVAQKLKIDGDVIQQKHHVLEVSYNNLPSHEQKLLSTIACFRSPVGLDTLVEISKPTKGKGILGFLKKITPIYVGELENDLQDLSERGLLHFDDKNKKFDLHPIVRHYAYEHLTASDRIAVHIRLRDFFATVNVSAQPQSLDELAPVIELYHHTVHANEFMKAIELFRDHISDLTYYKFGAYQLNIELLRALFAHAEDKPSLLQNEFAQAWALNGLANAYSLSGQPRRALLSYINAIGLWEKGNAKEYLAMGLGNVATYTKFPIGALKDAERDLRRYIELNHELKIEDKNANAWRDLGRALSYRGLWQEADNEFQTSQKFFENDGNFQGESILWSYRALHFLLMARANSRSKIANLKSSIESASRALELADKTIKIRYQHPLDYIHSYWLLGAAYRANGDLKQAERNLSKAITMCRQINAVVDEANILLDLARLRYDQKNYEEAKSLVEEALLITERCGYVLQGADVNLFLAQYALEQDKDKVKAKEYAETALKLAYCDGPPYYYKVAYEEAERMLENL